ncbi:MAG: transcription termination/antitermination protein NusG [Candidatus Izimaplasma sp.]|nr:transcription termination/antitermination protein NusG [Candidatus Izimaplasma bacterium]
MNKDKRLWYIVQTYSGLEDSVKLSLERRIETMNMEDLIFQVMIPEEIVIEEKADKSKKEKKVKIFPGYVFIEMIVTDDSWFVVRNTPGVTGFLGSSGGGTKPVPLKPEEINPILKKCGMLAVQRLNVQVGQKVRIAQGNFKGQEVVVESIDEDQGKINVLIEMFERQTTMELDFTEVEVIK